MANGDSVTVTIDVDNAKAIQWLKKLDHNAQHLKPVFRSSEKKLSSIYKSNFASDGSLGGGWAPLTPRYGAWKAVHYPGASTLVQTGHLFSSIAKFSVRTIDNQKAEFGTDARVAEFHQYGTWKMAQRKVIFEPPMFARELAHDVVEHVVP
jgi:phage gpG-like protein